MPLSGGEIRLSDGHWQWSRGGPIVAIREIGTLGPNATADFVAELCDSSAADYPDIDDEDLVRIGIYLAHARHAVAAGAALDWLIAAPSPARFGIACGLLGGMWISSSTGQCTAERAQLLVAARDRIEPGPIDDFHFPYTIWNALRYGLADEELNEEIAKSLRAAIDRSARRQSFPLSLFPDPAPADRAP